MKVYVDHPKHLSQGIYRVARALRQTAPDWVEITSNPDEADLRVLHVVGLANMEEWCQKGPYALIQYCLLTSEEHNSGVDYDPQSNPGRWMPIWEQARAVWSYYDLPAHIRKTRGVEPRINFLYAPLGVDPVFQPSMPARKRFVVGTSGYIADSECVGECVRAAANVRQSVLHLGPPLNLGPNVSYISNISDVDLADMWSQCSYVAGMRRIEGFELPALEGLMCGARPVMLDAPHYRAWFDEFAEFIPETHPDEVTDRLTELFSRPVRPVTKAERDLARERFSWPALCGKFWEALR